MLDLPDHPVAAPADLKARILERLEETPQATGSRERPAVFGSVLAIASYVALLGAICLPPLPRERRQSETFVRRSAELTEAVYAFCKTPSDRKE
ncbi:hypothetical protein ACFL59_03950 [Planctomycetota bacterium]